MTHPRIEMEMWLLLFEQRKRDLIAGGMKAELADEVASIEIRRRIRDEGFRGQLQQFIDRIGGT